MCEIGVTWQGAESIAVLVDLRPQALRFRLENAMRKLMTHNIAAAVAIAIAIGIL